MATTIGKSLDSPPHKTNKLPFVTLISLRVLTIAASLATACLMLTNKQTTMIYDTQFDARYSYSPAFKFFAYANIVAFVFLVLSLLLALMLERRAVDPTYYFYLFLHDLIMAALLISACAAATAVGYVGKYGNSHVGWIPICDHFAKFCNRGIASMVVCYVGLALMLILTVVSAKKSQQIQA